MAEVVIKSIEEGEHWTVEVHRFLEDFPAGVMSVPTRDRGLAEITFKRKPKGDWRKWSVKLTDAELEE